MRRFNSNKVKALGNLVPLNDKQKARLRSANGVKVRWSIDAPAPDNKPKERDFLTAVREDYRPPRLRGRSGTRLSPEKRALVEKRRADRAAFFASL